MPKKWLVVVFLIIFAVTILQSRLFLHRFESVLMNKASSLPTNLSVPRLIADIGGTYARFALEPSLGTFEQARSLQCADYQSFYDALTAYLNSVTVGQIQHAAIAIANPVDGDQVSMTNYHWQFSIEEMRQRLGFETLVVINDFTALASAVPGLKESQRKQIGGGKAREGSVIGVMGAGSGLGMSGLIPVDSGWVALGTEGGHTHFAPRDEQEVQILQFAWKQYEHVSFERLVSGAGLELIHQALLNQADLNQTQSVGTKPASKHSSQTLDAPEITKRAIEKTDALCVRATELFCLFLGTAASNLAVTLGALSGIYIGGGIVPKLGEFFERSGFRARFESKGRFSRYVQSIPTYVITEPNATFIGVSAILDAQLKAIAQSPQSALLDRITKEMSALSSAELRVAQYVMAHSRRCLTEPIAEIAEHSNVSQPTVIRFCRTMGCQGLAEFKLRLASELRGTLPLTHTLVKDDDSLLELGSKVLSNTASAILEVRDRLNQHEITQAIALLTQAERVDVFAVGQYSIVAQDAQFKILRLGVACAAFTEERLIQAAAAALSNKSVALFVSMEGESALLLEAAAQARARGCQSIVITTPGSALAESADVVLAVEHSEDLATQMPMVSRVLHLLIVDILTVGVAMQRSNPSRPMTAFNAELRKNKGKTLGVTTASPLTDLSSHSRE
jgi:glucokinase